jgi:hypothetical protein
MTGLNVRRMIMGVHYKSVARGFLAVVLALLGAGGYVWIATVRLEPSGRTGQQILLLLFAPGILAALVYYIARGLHRVLSGLTRFEMTDRMLTVQGPLRTRVIGWASIKDFFLPPARFPDPPQSLVLVPADGRPVVLPVARLRAAGAEALILASVRCLPEWGMERVRAAKPATLSPMKVRWQLHKSVLVLLYGMLILFLVAALGGILVSWNYVNYLRIRHSHVSAWAEVTQIDKESSGKDETTWTRIRYVAANGRTVRLRRQVKPQFAEQYQTGDRVTVDYLPDHPAIARIPGWDLDDRQWMMLIFTVPLAWVTFRATKRGIAIWLGPLRERLAWSAAHDSPLCAFSGASLNSLSAIFPDLHVGTMVLKPPPPGSKKPGVGAWARWLDRAGIEARRAAGKFLILAPAQSQRLLERLGGSNAFLGGYVLLDCGASDEAERLISEQLALARAGGRRATGEG